MTEEERYSRRESRTASFWTAILIGVAVLVSLAAWMVVNP